VVETLSIAVIASAVNRERSQLRALDSSQSRPLSLHSRIRSREARARILIANLAIVEILNLRIAADSHSVGSVRISHLYTTIGERPVGAALARHASEV
jgi:hypothetical protein